MKVWEYDHKVSKPWHNIRVQMSYTGGIYCCKYGMVDVLQSDYVHQLKKVFFCAFTMVHEDRVYTRNVSGKKYTITGLARLAGKFAKDVVEKQNLKNHGYNIR